MEPSDFSALPRSVRWRIQLGIFVNPSLEDPTAPTNLESCLQWNKDVLTNETTRFKQLMEKYIEENEEERKQQESEEKAAAAAANAHAVAVDVDPLTAIVREKEERESRKAELYLKYRKEKARRKRGLAVESGNYSGGNGENDGIDRASLVIIEKDLKRLPHPTNAGQPLSPSENSPACEERIVSLKDMLYIYAQEHPRMGYRQGMHEIASFILFLLELEQADYPDHPLFNPILPISFALLERTLDQLQTAYDASVEESLQQMSHSILGKIHQNDPGLFHYLINSPSIPPPPIYCTRWVRLLFSREVTGYENVYKLWDVFFEFNVMRALEVATASRILLLRDALMNPDNNPLDLLMNVPPLTDIEPFAQCVRLLMKQTDADKAVTLPAPQIVPPKSLMQDSQDSALVPQMPEPQQFGSVGSVGSNSSNDPLRSPMGDDAKKQFSFSKMRQSLGQKGESLRKKIITTTNEWKTQAQREGSATISTSSSDFFTSATEAIRNHSITRKPTETVLFADPLLNTPPSPMKHQHEMWSQLLKKRIWTVQEFLMSIESNDDGNNNKVPREVWEALADLDRMQQELHNYGQYMS